ncbi:MAG: hypothetical protein LHV69_00330 [Elusimicrobia bacterium]|nr:hypothetical protein [Candidatus Obscuribacterium magneticum]MCB4755477.1 hypothetical protein [Candidatus Obscuribacterium magneticum]
MNPHIKNGKHRRRWPGLFLTGLIGLALALFLAESISRFVFKKNVEALAMSDSDLYYYYDKDGVRHHIPNKVGYERMWNGDGKAEFRINSLGFRGGEISIPKPPGTTRILFLGDSITLGGRLPQEVIFVERVAQKLKAKLKNFIEVINAGTGDVGLLEEEETLKTKGLNLSPDVVILCWYLNDGRPPVGFPEETIYKNPAIRWFNEQGILKKSYLFGFLYDAMRRFLVKRQIGLMDSKNRRFDWAEPYMKGEWVNDPKAFEELIRLARYDWGDAWNEKSQIMMFQKIKSLRDMTVARNARFGVVALPLHAQIYAAFEAPLVDAPQTKLIEFCRQENIPCLNLLPALRKHKAEALFYDNCHYTPRGNEIVAEEIFHQAATLLSTEKGVF